jgi:hypothetical protein
MPLCLKLGEQDGGQSVEVQWSSRRFTVLTSRIGEKSQKHKILKFFATLKLSQLFAQNFSLFALTVAYVATNYKFFSAGFSGFRTTFTVLIGAINLQPRRACMQITK